MIDAPEGTHAQIECLEPRVQLAQLECRIENRAVQLAQPAEESVEILRPLADEALGERQLALDALDQELAGLLDQRALLLGKPMQLLFVPDLGREPRVLRCKLRGAVHEVSRELVVAPVERELEAFRTVRTGLDKALAA